MNHPESFRDGVIGAPVSFNDSQAVYSIGASGINHSCPTFHLRTQVKPLKTQAGYRHLNAGNVLR